MVLEWRLWRLSRRSDRMFSISELVPRLCTLSDGDSRPRRLSWPRSPDMEDTGNMSGVSEHESSVSGVPSWRLGAAGDIAPSGVFSLPSLLVNS